MLWTVFNRWRRGNRFVFNCYRHHNIVIVHDEVGMPPIILFSEKGVAQGYCFGTVLEGIAMMPLCKGAWEHVKGSLQTWFADDLGAAGKAKLNA
ncbi:hypothetical protein ACHAWF_005400 [Thalassiosira exigua]